MNKILRLGTNKTDGGRHYSVYARVEIENGELRINGVEGPLSSGNAIGSCGQIIMSPYIFESLKLAPKWDDKMLITFSYVWKVWHQNHMNSACKHQRQLGQTWTTHPSSECITCGYVLGSSWLKEELPETVVAFLESLPETDKTPSWV